MDNYLAMYTDFSALPQDIYKTFAVLPRHKPTRSISTPLDELITITLDRALLAPLRDIVRIINDQDEHSLTYIANTVYGNKRASR